MIKKASSYLDAYGAYPLYIAVACVFTAGLNIVHTKYILGIPLEPSFFIIPTIAGAIFGHLSAKVRLINYRIAEPGNLQVFLKYIFLSCLVTFGLNIVHTEWIMKTTLRSDLFIAPLIAGIFFGYLLARIKTLNNTLLKLATTDTLTQLYNRMQFDNFLVSEIEKVKRYGGTFSIIYFDIDNFKQINDQYGHQAGDKVLAHLANHIDKMKRKSDLLARYGGDEFIVLAPSTNLKAAQKLADSLKQAIDHLKIEGLPRLACSFGVTEFKEDQHNTNSLIEVVDKALYAAKNSGKNSIVVSG